MSFNINIQKTQCRCVEVLINTSVLAAHLFWRLKSRSVSLLVALLKGTKECSACRLPWLTHTYLSCWCLTINSLSIPLSYFYLLPLLGKDQAQIFCPVIDMTCFAEKFFLCKKSLSWDINATICVHFRSFTFMGNSSGGSRIYWRGRFPYGDAKVWHSVLLEY